VGLGGLSKGMRIHEFTNELLRRLKVRQERLMLSNVVVQPDLNTYWSNAVQYEALKSLITDIEGEFKDIIRLEDED
jgi:hypothetical protein